MSWPIETIILYYSVASNNFAVDGRSMPQFWCLWCATVFDFISWKEAFDLWILVGPRPGHNQTTNDNDVLYALYNSLWWCFLAQKKIRNRLPFKYDILLKKVKKEQILWYFILNSNEINNLNHKQKALHWPMCIKTVRTCETWSSMYCSLQNKLDKKIKRVTGKKSWPSISASVTFTSHPVLAEFFGSVHGSFGVQFLAIAVLLLY